jgi:hypothetical protein
MTTGLSNASLRVHRLAEVRQIHPLARRIQAYRGSGMNNGERTHMDPRSGIEGPKSEVSPALSDL